MIVDSPLPDRETPEEAKRAGPGTGEHPILEEFRRVDELLRKTQREVAEAWNARSERIADPSERGRLKKRTTISLDRCPWLLDHRFYSLPPGWPEPSDGYPVVPLTMSLEMMVDAARDLAPERRVVGVEELRAFRWLSCEEPVEIEIDAVLRGEDRIRVRIGDHVEGTVVVGRGTPHPPREEALRLSAEERALEITPEQAYARRLLFHGPRYRSLARVHAIASDGIHGEIQCLEAPGSLLDGAGQLLGLWIRLGSDAMPAAIAMPVSIHRLTFFGPEARPGDRFECVVRVRHSGEQRVRADMEISRGGRIWARVDGWVDRKMRTSEELWRAVEQPEKRFVARALPGAPSARWLPEPFDQAATRDHFARWYLTRVERREYFELPPGRRDEWLGGRIAVKDAARRVLMEGERKLVWPIEIEVLSGPGEAAAIRTRGGEELHGSIAHEGEAVVAIAARGEKVGIALVRVEPEGKSRGVDAITVEERDLLAGRDEDTDEWRARLLAAKEAVAKRNGVSLHGVGGKLPVERIESERVIVNGNAVETRRVADRVAAWTVPGATRR